ncbi:MAG: hypothetical protein ACI8Z7_000162 [Candidatus Nanohaloarchaea archaeon]|jgi:hypothetical protein
MSKGFAYTSFALLSATLLLSLIFFQVYQPTDIGNANAERIGEASFFLDSVFKDTDRTLRIATRRAFTGAVSEVVTDGSPLEDPQRNITEIMVNGTLGGQEVDSVENASLSKWEQKVSGIASDSGYALNITVVNSSFNSSGFEIYSSFNVTAQLKDPVTRARFNRTHYTETTTSIRDLEDPMITVRSRGRYTETVRECGFEQPAERVLTAEQNTSDTAYGELEVQPSDLSSVDSEGSKILAVQDPDSYSSDQLNQFEGVIGAESYSTPSQLTNAYALETGSLSGFEDRDNAVIDSGRIWSTGFSQMFEEGCYIESQEAPSFTDRLENSADADSEGIVTLIDVPELPPELQKSDASAVGFIYFSDSASDNPRSIKGVSTPDDYPWFRIDEEHVEEWNLEGLAE